MNWALSTLSGLRRRTMTDRMRVHAAFEGGNVEAAEVVSPGHIRFSARAYDSPRPLWFYFCIENASTAAVRCDLMNADLCLGPRFGWRTARPVFSSDGETWTRVSKADYHLKSPRAGYFTFTVPVVGRRTYVAYSYPYTTRDLRALLQTLPPSVRVEQLHRTPQQLVVPYLRCGRPNASAAVWVVARQHAGETPASFVAEGLLRALAERGPDGCGDLEFHLAPMLDVAGVYEGRYGKDQGPVDFNRDWRDTPARPAVAALIRRMRHTARRQRVQLVLDLHASHHGDHSCYLFGEAKQQVGDDNALLPKMLLRTLAAEAPPGIGFRETDFRIADAPPNSAREYLAPLLGAPVYTLELSYHLAQSGRYLTPSLYREFGAALADTLVHIFSTSAASQPY